MGWWGGTSWGGKDWSLREDEAAIHLPPLGVKIADGLEAYHNKQHSGTIVGATEGACYTGSSRHQGTGSHCINIGFEGQRGSWAAAEWDRVQRSNGEMQGMHQRCGLKQSAAVCSNTACSADAYDTAFNTANKIAGGVVCGSVCCTLGVQRCC